MRILGIVLELNPIHNGHLYFIEEAKKQVHPDLTIAVVSSSFTMRGDIMVMDKFTKAKILRKLGIDIILELPYLASVCSADYFCYNAIETLLKCNITDLSFGVELNDLEKLNKMKDIINSDYYNNFIKEYSSRGFSYPNSCFKALMKVTNDQTLINNFTLPNNTLAIGYLNSLEKLQSKYITKPNITLIQRIGSEEYDNAISDEKYISAGALRKMLINNENINDFTSISYPWIDQVSSYSKLFLILKYLFNVNDISHFKNILGMNEGIENRIASFINKSNSYDELVNNIQTKRYSQNRIKRLLLNIVLNVPKEYENNFFNYLRILAISNEGIEYLNTLPKQIKKEIITSFKQKNDIISKMELKVTKLYSLLTDNFDIEKNEYNVPYRDKN